MAILLVFIGWENSRYFRG